VHVIIALALAAVAIFLIVVIAGATPFVGIPIVVLALGIAALWAMLTRRMGERTLESDAPSTREASYDPVSDPGERR
jgi:putative sensor protein